MRGVSAMTPAPIEYFGTCGTRLSSMAGCFGVSV